MHKKTLIKKAQAGLTLGNSPASFNFSQFGGWGQGLFNLGSNSQMLGGLNLDPSLSVTSNTGIKNKFPNIQPVKTQPIAKEQPTTVKLPSIPDMKSILNTSSAGKFNPQQSTNFLNSRMGGIASQVGSSLIESIPTKDKEINSTDATLGNVRDSANKALMSGAAGPWGMLAGAVNTVVGKLGGNSDASSGLGAGNDTLNAIASFTPGLGFFAGKIKGVDKSQELQESSGFAGLQNSIDKANKNSGKIVFGRGAAKRKIADAQSKANIATGLLKTANQNMTAATNSADMFRLRNQRGMTDNSYLYNGALSARQGARITRIIKSQQGNKFETFRKTLPKPLQDTVYYRLETLWNLGGKPQNFESAKKLGLFEDVGGEYHAPSVIRDSKLDEYIFLKVPSHPSVGKELDWYNSADEEEFRSNYDLNKSGDIWKYVPKKGKEASKHANGGKMNVIPEGALHAHKHNLSDVKDITKKGIPVISDEDGGVLQHAEIEREEIIFTKEVTEKLEELKKLGTDEAAIQAGILLANEIIENTDDRANLMKKIEG